MNRSESILSYQPRRPAPWNAVHLAAIVIFYLAAQTVVVLLATAILGAETVRPPTIYDPDKLNAGHVVAQMLKDADAWLLLICIVSAVVVAPVVEEFLFRVVLQSWLEKLQRRWRRRMPTLRLVPRAVGPIALTSLFFARLHFRVDGPELNVKFLTFLLAGNSVASLLTLVFAVVVLRWNAGATAADLGWMPRRLPADIGLGLLMFGVVAGPIYALQIWLSLSLPKYLAPDPFTLLLLAIVLGSLYYRTHRIVPIVVLHAALNGTSLALALLARLAV